MGEPVIAMCVIGVFLIGFLLGMAMRGNDKQVRDVRCRIFGHRGEAADYEGGGYCERCGYVWSCDPAEEGE